MSSHRFAKGRSERFPSVAIAGLLLLVVAAMPWIWPLERPKEPTRLRQASAAERQIPSILPPILDQDASEH